MSNTAFEYKELVPDQAQIDMIVRTMFRHASSGTYVSLRAFYDDNTDKPFRISPVQLTDRADSLDFLIKTAENDAYRAANDPKKVVFCPPIATFNNPKQAREADLAEGLALSVECDQRAQEARRKLEELLGPATLVVTSGGKWTDPETGENHAKLHLHWRLAVPAIGEDLRLLKQARTLAAAIVGGDPSNKPIVHPIRWPGSWHRKADPTLCVIDTAYPDNEIDLVKALSILKVAAPSRPSETASQAKDKASIFETFGQSQQQWQRPDDYIALMDKIRTGEAYHEPLVSLSARFIGSGMRDRTVVALLEDLMNASSGPRDDRWNSRYSGIDRIVSTAREKFGAAGGSVDSPPIAPDQAPPIVATPYTWRDPATIPRRDFLYGKHLIRKFVSATIALGGSGKSTLIVAQALACVSGRGLLGSAPDKPLRVWLWNLEDPREETERKIQAAAKHYGLTPDDIGDRLFVDTGREQELVIAETSRDGTTKIIRPVVDSIVEQITERQIDVVVIDPFVSSHRVKENLNDDMDMVVKEWGRVADRGNCSIELIHHVRKGNGAMVTVESSRGGSAATDGARSVRVVNRMTEDEAKKAGVQNNRLYFRTYVDKGNLAPPAETSDWYELRSVDLGNGTPFVCPGAPPEGVRIGGDSVGVAVAWKWPDHMADVTGKDFERAASEIRAGKWRLDSQAKQWVGYAVAKALKLDPRNKPADKAKIKTILKVWLDAGSIVVVDGKDEKRNDRQFVEVADDD